MAVRGLVAVDDLQGGARRWAVPAMAAPCPVTVVSMVVVPPMPNLGVMAAAIANDALHGMESGTSREVPIDPAIGLVSALVIDPVIGSRSGLGSVSVIARKSGSAIAPVPLTEIRTPPALSLIHI